MWLQGWLVANQWRWSSRLQSLLSNVVAGRYGVVTGRQAVKKMHGDQDHTRASRIPWVACTLPRSIGEGELTYEALRNKCAAISLEVRVEQRPPHL